MLNRKLVSAAAIGVLVLMVLGIAWLLLTYGAAVLFWSYTGIGVLTLIAASEGAFSRWRRGGTADPYAVEAEVVRARMSSSPLQRYRFTATMILSGLAESLAWPATVVSAIVGVAKHGIHRNNVRSIAYVANVGLNPPITVFSIATAAMVAAIFIADWLLPDTYGYRHIVLFMLALSVLIKHLAAFVSEQSISKMLRSSLGEPYVKFFAIGVADFVSLVLAFAAYYAASVSQVLGFDHLRDIAVDMLTFAKLRAALSGAGALSLFDALVALAGGLYLANGFKSVLKYQDFGRTTEDLHAIAGSQLAIGNHREARKWLDRIKAREALTFELYAGVYLEAGDMENAQHAAETFADERKVPPAARSSEVARVLMLAAASLPMKEEQRMRLLKHWVSSALRTPFIQAAIEGIIRNKRLDVDDLLQLFDSDDAKARHALAYATLLIHAGTDAEPVLRAYTPENPTEHILHFGLLYRCLWIKTLDERSTDSLHALHRWHVESLDRIRLWATRISTEFERLVAIECLSMLCVLADCSGLPHARQLNEVALSLRDELGGDERVSLVLRTVDGVLVAFERDLRRRFAAAPGDAAWLRHNLHDLGDGQAAPVS